MWEESAIKPKPKPKPTKKPNGRPPRYTPDFCERLGGEMLRWFSRKNNIWLKDFATKNLIPWDAFQDLAKVSDSFSRSLKIAKQMQESKLVMLGLDRNRNVAMAIFALKNVAGWRDKQDINIGSLSDEQGEALQKLADKVLRDAV